MLNFDVLFNDMKKLNDNFVNKDVNEILKVVKEIYHVKMQIPTEFFAERLQD